MLLLLSCSCNRSKQLAQTLKPLLVTDTVFGDTDDPAIWINRDYPDSSLVLGTDKDKINGGVYVFTLNGKIDR